MPMFQQITDKGNGITMIAFDQLRFIPLLGLRGNIAPVQALGC